MEVKLTEVLSEIRRDSDDKFNEIKRELTEIRSEIKSLNQFKAKVVGAYILAIFISGLIFSKTLDITTFFSP